MTVLTIALVLAVAVVALVIYEASQDAKQDRERRSALAGFFVAPPSAEKGRPVRADDKRRILREQGGVCNNPFCRADLSREIVHWDHIVPRCNRGSDDPSNIQALCQPCNNRKGTRGWGDFLARESRGNVISLPSAPTKVN